METAKLTLEYITVVIWPIVILCIMLFYRKPILSLLGASKIKLSMFGVTIETTVPLLEDIVTDPLGGILSQKQWEWLKKLYEHGGISVKEEKLELAGKDRDWIRPIRNAGLIRTLPEGHIIEVAETLKLTKLGELIVQAKYKRSIKEKDQED